MLNSPALEVAIGLVFCFASVALMASSAKEAVASIFGLRARTLFAGIKDLLNDQKFDGLARAVYNHALVNARDNGHLRPGAKFSEIRGAPSYVDARHFATALVDAMQGTPGNMVQLRSTIENMPDLQLRVLFQGMYLRAAGDVERLEAQIADWFVSGMDRVSGFYKRRAQLLSFLAGLLIAAGLNVDSVRLCRELWKHPGEVAQISSPGPRSDATPTVGEAIWGLEQLPIGRPYRELAAPSDWIWNLVGLFITASAAMFGAPFWFDLLQRLVQLRSSGPKPPVKGVQPR